MKPPNKSNPSDGHVPHHVLNNEFIIAKTKLAEDQARGVRTREKANRLMLAKVRDEVIDKDLVIKQATFLFVAMRQKMLSAPLAWSRRFVGLQTQREALERLIEMQHELLRELHDMPRKVTDPNWIETLDEEDGK